MKQQMVSINVHMTKSLYKKGEELVEKGFFQDLSELTRISLAEKVLSLLEITKKTDSYKSKLEKAREGVLANKLIKKKSVADIIKNLRKTRSKLWKQKYAKLYSHIG